MKTRVIQDGNGSTAGSSGNGAAPGPHRARNLAARMGHWSATHRKTAIFGWLGFVVLAVLIGQAGGQNQIHRADDFSGESGRAEQALYGPRPRPNTPPPFNPSKNPTIRDPPLRSAARDHAPRLMHTKYVAD